MHKLIRRLYSAIAQNCFLTLNRPSIALHQKLATGATAYLLFDSSVILDVTPVNVQRQSKEATPDVVVDMKDLKSNFTLTFLSIDTLKDIKECGEGGMLLCLDVCSPGLLWIFVHLVLYVAFQHVVILSLLLGLLDKVNLKWNTLNTTTATSFLAAWLLNNILFISWLMSENVDLISKHASEIPKNVSVVLLGLHQCFSSQNKESTSNETQRTQQVIVLCYLSISCPKIDELMFTLFFSNSERHLIHLPPGDSNRKSWRPKFRVSLRFKSQHFSLGWRVTKYIYSTCIQNLYSNTSLM